MENAGLEAVYLKRQCVDLAGSVEVAEEVFGGGGFLGYVDAVVVPFDALGHGRRGQVHGEGAAVQAVERHVEPAVGEGAVAGEARPVVGVEVVLEP